MEKLNKSEQRGYLWLVTKDSTTSTEYAHGMDVAARTALNHLSKMVEVGLAEKSGDGPTTLYAEKK